MNWNRAGRALGWATYNGIWYLLAALGAVAGIGWAFNIFAFLTWASLAVALLLTWYKGQCKRHNEPYTVASMPVPMWLDFVCDMALAIMLAATGHWFYAAMVIFNEVMFVDAVKSTPVPPVSS